MDFDKYLNQPFPNQRELNYFLSKSEKLIIFEVGACEGEDTIKYARFFKYSEIHAFEPHPINFLKLSNNIDYYGVSAKLNQLALSNMRGKAKFYLSSAEEKKNTSENWDYGNKSSPLHKT